MVQITKKLILPFKKREKSNYGERYLDFRKRKKRDRERD
jgi:hypothetical protein